MINKQNLHTHSVLCDGKDTLEQMVLKAIEKGFDSVGFSGHSYMDFLPEIGMNEKESEIYKKEICRLKEKYRDIIKIYYGLEFELYSKVDLSGYDYLIGSCHNIDFGGKILEVDNLQEYAEANVREFFGGDGLAYAKKYYETLATLPEHGKFDIIGHFDVVTKFSQRVNLFDEDSKEYRSAAIEAAQALAGKIPFFEVNTGAISRGYKKSPYPNKFIIKEMKRLGFGAVITSDCHNKDYLDSYFDEAAELLKECGFKERYVLTDEGFKAVSL